MAKFSKATRKQAKARLAIVGPSGSGKTYTALMVAQYLGKRVAVIDTEHGSASKYAPAEGEQADGKTTFDFEVQELDSYAPSTYSESIRDAETEGFDVIIIDSLSHAWIGKDGALEQADRASAKSGENRFTAWRHVTPGHNALIESIVGCRAHVIATMRTKTEYVIEENEKGKKMPRKIGLAPVQRDGMEYEFDLFGDINHEHTLVVSKSRCPALADAVIHKPGKEFAEALSEWLATGSPVADPLQQIAKDAEVVSTAGELAALKTRANAIYKKCSEKDKELLRAAVETATRVFANTSETQ